MGYYLPTVVKPAEKKVEVEAPVVEEKKAVVTAPYYYHPYAYGAYNYAPYVYNHAAVVKPYTYYANSGGAVHIVKREAEAEAEADPKAWYGYAGYHPYTYGYGFGHRYAHYAYPYTYGAYRYGGYTHGYYYGK